jgi:hypothetical protein
MRLPSIAILSKQLPALGGANGPACAMQSSNQFLDSWIEER